MVGVILLVLIFRKSGNLAAAYGIAVSIDMLITTLLITVIARSRWRSPLWLVLIGAAVFLALTDRFSSPTS